LLSQKRSFSLQLLPEPFMKLMLLTGLILVVLGIASLLVPIPHTEKHGIKAGDVNIGVETTQSERVSPIISVVLIAGGIALTVGGARTRSSTK
jgi:predicted membrane channel-forming protein YqfA (hemolysin III family)